MPDHSCCVLLYTELHSVLFVQYVFIQTEQAETYPKIYVSIDNSTFFCPSLFGWKEKMISRKPWIPNSESAIFA